MLNDWPYGVEKGIVHIVVWTKFTLAEDPATGDLTDAARKDIDDYVQKKFCTQLPPERVSALFPNLGRLAGKALAPVNCAM